MGNAYHTESEAKVMSHVNMTKLYEAINVPIDSVVDASMESLISVFQPGNLCPFRRNILSKMERNEPINIHILGGSVTVGADLRDPRNQRWSKSFEDTMNSGWYSNRINVHNQAIAACNVNIWVNMVSKFKDADMVIVDLSVNDQGFELQALPHYYTTLIQQLDNLPNHPALLFMQAFRSAQKDPNEVQKHCPADYTSCCDGVMFCRRWWEMHDFVAIALKKYRIPFVSYRNLVWPDYDHPANNVNLFWNGLSHPDYKAHRLISKLLSVGFMMQIRHVHRTDCSDVAKQQYLSPHLVDSSAHSVCSVPLVAMHAADTAESASSFDVQSSGAYWRFYNDSKNKFGWILETNKTSLQQECASSDGSTWCDAAIPKHTLTLRIKLSEDTPVIQLKYLKSYAEEMGSVKVWMDDDVSDAVELNSKWDSPYSVMHMATLSKQKLSVNTLMLGETHIYPKLSKGEHLLRISGANMPAQKFKWKLLGVTTC